MVPGVFGPTDENARSPMQVREKDLVALRHLT